MKIAKVPAAPQRSPITVALSQAYCVPPHSRARRNWMAAGAKSAKPRRSNLASVVRSGGFSVEVLLTVRSGIAMRRRRMATAPPMGRLM
jgi:hypothetical protein